MVSNPLHPERSWGRLAPLRGSDKEPIVLAGDSRWLRGAYDSNMAVDNVAIRPTVPADSTAMIEIGRALPDWFNDQGLHEMAVDIDHQLGAVAHIDGQIVGFVTWFAAEGVGMIGWIAVSPDVHRSGIGARLVEYAERRLAASGATELRVDTLGESVDYEPYERTRAFYRAVGFVDFESVMTDNPGMPERLTLTKTIGDSGGD